MFRRLVRGNDWGHLYVETQESIEGNPYAGCDSARALKLPSMVKIRWPNGRVETTDVIYMEFNTTVNDHGSSYNVRSQYPGVNTHVNGIETWIPIDQVDVDLDPDDQGNKDS